MSRQIKDILTLSDRLTAHEGITHWGLSMRLFGKGDFIDRLMRGGDLRTKTAERAMGALSSHWPDDLEWPQHITRPEAAPNEESGHAQAQ